MFHRVALATNQRPERVGLIVSARFFFLPRGGVLRCGWVHCTKTGRKAKNGGDFVANRACFDCHHDILLKIYKKNKPRLLHKEARFKAMSLLPEGLALLGSDIAVGLLLTPVGFGHTQAGRGHQSTPCRRFVSHCRYLRPSVVSSLWPPHVEQTPYAVFLRLALAGGGHPALRSQAPTVNS